MDKTIDDATGVLETEVAQPEGLVDKDLAEDGPAQGLAGDRLEDGPGNHPEDGLARDLAADRPDALAEGLPDDSGLDYELFDDTDREGLFDGDRGDLPPEARYALTRLVRDRYVADEAGGRFRTSTYALILQYREDLQRNLNNLCLTLNVNEKYRVAWASTAPFDGNMPGVVLKRANVQKRDVTLLLIALRIAAQNAELEGRERWYIDRATIVDAFVTISPYADDGNAAQVQKSIDAAIAEACTYGYMERTTAAEDRFRILPIVPAILTLDRAQELIAELEGIVGNGKGE